MANNCDDCFYYRAMSNGKARYCAYLIDTGQRRPCPPGDGCTVKVPREVKRRAKKEESDGTD